MAGPAAERIGRANRLTVRREQTRGAKSKRVLSPRKSFHDILSLCNVCPCGTARGLDDVARSFGAAVDRRTMGRREAMEGARAQAAPARSPFRSKLVDM
jgi:hypothetical protein